MKKIILFGANGLLGKALVNNVDLSMNAEVIPITRNDINFLKVYKYKDLIKILPKFDILINTMGFTNTQVCENQIELSNHLNGACLEEFSKLTNYYNAKLFHISTDYVFDGKTKKLLTENDKKCPICQYGRSKLFGENLIHKISNNFVIIRTSSLYGPYFNYPHFVEKIRRKIEQNKKFKVVADQYMSPTYTIELSKFIGFKSQNLNKENEIYHFSDIGSCSWYEFALYYVKLSKKEINFFPCSINEYPSTFKRPINTSLSTNKVNQIFKLKSWQENLKSYYYKYIINY